MRRASFWAAVVLLNAALAAFVQAAAPPEPKNSDRNRYEFAGAHPFSVSCPPYAGLYCYRVLVPALLEQIPAEPPRRWRWYRWAGATGAGSVIASVSASLTGLPATAVVATLLTQGSYGFAFTAYDPYSADAAVFVVIAIVAWCWLRDRWDLALVAGAIGIFAKESVAAMSVATALAALVPPRRPGWRRWIAQGVAIVVLLAVYRFAMQAVLGWELAGSAIAATDLMHGGWIGIWLGSNAPSTNAFLLFATFGFAWLFAVAGYRRAPDGWRALTIGSLLPFLALNYVQNPDRALGNIFFIVVPLASIALAAVSPIWATGAALLTAVISTRAGTTTDWLPSAKYMFVPAATAAFAVLWYQARKPGRAARVQTISRA